MQVSVWAFLAQQFLASASLLTAIALCMGQPRASPWRLVLTALFLSLATMAAVGLPLPGRLLAAGLCAASPLAAWPGAPGRFRPRLMLLGCAFPLLLAGLMRLTASLPGALSLPLACGALLLLARVDGPVLPLPWCILVEVTWQRRSTVLTALVDSGNLLRDGVTGLPVIVISRSAAARITRLPPEGALMPGMRLIPVRTVSGVSLMTLLRPDRLRVRCGSAWQEQRALIGLSPGGGESFQALVPSCLVSGLTPPAARRAATP